MGAFKIVVSLVVVAWITAGILVSEGDGAIDIDTDTDTDSADTTGALVNIILDSIRTAQRADFCGGGEPNIVVGVVFCG